MDQWYVSQVFLGVKMSVVLTTLNLAGMSICGTWISEEVQPEKSIRGRIEKVALVAFLGGGSALACVNYAKIASYSQGYFYLVFLAVGSVVFRHYFKLVRRSLAKFSKGDFGVAGWELWFDGEKLNKLQECLKVSFFRGSLRATAALSIAEVVVALMSRSRSPDAVTDRPLHLSPALGLIGDLTPVFSAIVVAWLFCIIPRWIRPSGTLLEKCFGHVFSDGSYSLDGRHGQGVASWRSQRHATMFEVARCIERCVPGLRSILSYRQFEGTSAAYMDLAEAIRDDAIRSSDKYPSPRGNWLLLMASTLVVNDNPVASARRISRIVPSTGREAPKTSTWSRILSGSNEALEKNAKLLVASGVLIVVANYVWRGQFQELIKFLQALVGG